MLQLRLVQTSDVPALAQPWVAQALQIHEPGPKPKRWLDLAWPGFGLVQGF